MVEILKQIQNLIKGEIKDDPVTLAVFSKDASLYKVRPAAVVYPKDASDIQALVKFAAREKAEGRDVSLTTRGGGTDMSGGALGQSLVLSMTRYFNRIVSFGKDFVVIQAGVFYRDLEKEAAKRNLLLPSFPASKEICTVGGMVGNNAGGELNLLYGKTDRYIRELKMVCSDGREYSFKPLTLAELKKKQSQDGFEGRLYKQLFELVDRNYDLLKTAKPQVSKNSAGYYLWNIYDRETGMFDLTQLLVGSQGTLGVITEIKFGLVQPRAFERLLVVFLNDLHQIPQVVSHLLKFHPQSIESYDDKTFRLALKLLPDIVARLQGGIFKLLFGFLPELWMAITGGIPKLVLLVEFCGDSDREAAALARHAEGSLAGLGLKTRIIENKQEAEKYWIIRRESFNMLRHHVQGMRTAPFIDDFIVRPEFLGEFLPKLYAILDRYKLLYTIAGHVGDGNFHIIPLLKLKDQAGPEVVEKLGQEVFDLVFSYKGSMSGEHNDGLVRSHYLKQMYGPEIYGLFEQTKKIFDPQDIFNPGKKVNSSFEYSQRHLDI